MSLRLLTSLLRASTAPAVVFAFAWMGLGIAAPAGAQVVEDNFGGVSLGLTYDTRTLPVLAIQPFSGVRGGEAIAREIENIIARDLRNSNRFQVIDQLPAALVRDEVDYTVWNQMRADYLVTGRIEGAGSTAVLVLELHDVLYQSVRDRARFSLPPPTPARDFRMGVHVASDAVVEWAFGEPGIAATRIVYSVRASDGSQDLWIVDSDGEFPQRLTRTQVAPGGVSISISPTWSPDGSRIAYVSWKDTGRARIYELDLATGRERILPAPRDGDYLTPSYHPDGERLFFSITGGNRGGIFSYNITRDCCFTNLIEGRYDEISPTFAPDGSFLAFNTNRLGTTRPQIYLARGTGTPDAVALSPDLVATQGYYTSPDWSPLGNRIAFHGRVERRGEHQILVANLDARNRVVLPLSKVSLEGTNEDPSWAPDGRHIVYVGERSWGKGLFVVDILTPGSERVLVRGVDVNPPAWSPSLASP